MTPTVSPVLIHGSGKARDGRISYHSWTPAERKSRALKKTGKIVGTMLAVSLLGLFAHLLLPFFVAIDLIVILSSMFLYLRYLNEEATFLHVEGTCPHCGQAGRLKPYLSTRYEREVTVHCPGCGQTSRAETQATA